MFGKLLGSAIRIVTLPIDAANAALDIAAGGDGSKESRTEDSITGDLEKLRDKVAETADEIDDD
jgi:hypothetical protein